MQVADYVYVAVAGPPGRQRKSNPVELVQLIRGACTLSTTRARQVRGMRQEPP